MSEFSKISKLTAIKRAGWLTKPKMQPMRKTYEDTHVLLRKGDIEILKAAHSEGVGRWIRARVAERCDEIRKELGLPKPPDVAKPGRPIGTGRPKGTKVEQKPDNYAQLRAIIDDPNF